MAVALKNIDFEGSTNENMLRFLGWFAQNTTDKIFRRMERLDIGDTGALRASIRAVVLNNAGGNDWLVRFYYLNYGRFIEMGLGHNRGSDADLGREGVKVRNAKVPQITSWDYDPLTMQFEGQTDAGVPVGPMGKAIVKKNGKRVVEERERAQYHKAKPFLFNSIRAEMRRISERMAQRLAYHGAINMLYGVVGAFDVALSEDASNDEYTRVTKANIDELIRLVEHPWFLREGYVINTEFNYETYVESGTLK